MNKIILSDYYFIFLNIFLGLFYLSACNQSVEKENTDNHPQQENNKPQKKRELSPKKEKDEPIKNERKDNLSRELREVPKSFLDNQNFTLQLFEENKNKPSFDYDTAFHNTKNGNFMISTMKIGNFFNKKHNHAIVAYSLSDTTIHLSIFSKKTSIWKKIYENPNLNIYCSGDCGGLNLINKKIFIEDINQDYTPDLLLVYSRTTFHFTQFLHLWLYDDRNDILRMIPAFSKIPNPEASNNHIYSYQSVGCADLAMSFKIYEWINGNPFIKEHYYYDCCENNYTKCSVKITNYEYGKEIKTEKFESPAKTAAQYLPTYWRKGVNGKLNRK
jgi:hypothetical protein